MTTTENGESVEPRVLTSAAEVKAAVGRELGPGDWFTVAQPRIDGFAADTEDHQWIHVDPERATDGPFGGTIAHGFLTLSLVPYLLKGIRRIENTTMGINYGMEKVRFPAPVPAGGRIRARGTILDAADLPGNGLHITTRVTVELEGSGKPACVVDLVNRSYFAFS